MNYTYFSSPYITGPHTTMVSIIPARLRDSEKDQTLSEWEWEKLLLERLILRKELRLQSMQDKLHKQQQCIEEKEDKIKMMSEDIKEVEEKTFLL